MSLAIHVLHTSYFLTSGLSVDVKHTESLKSTVHPAPEVHEFLVRRMGFRSYAPGFCMYLHEIHLIL